MLCERLHRVVSFNSSAKSYTPSISTSVMAGQTNAANVPASPAVRIEAIVAQGRKIDPSEIVVEAIVIASLVWQKRGKHLQSLAVSEKRRQKMESSACPPLTLSRSLAAAPPRTRTRCAIGTTLSPLSRELRKCR